ncbi:hypothetical protein CTI12_AA202640 (chloroplast) [Artemisia annua]|uniref:Uncharacterized protein n=1 Tax=Artemisia annua TaxID=35608 RepID=A0A2U1P248_ARTAN|nr:hypothetical protein CTI12_AA202640 [Artemisia annua]
MAKGKDVRIPKDIDIVQSLGVDAYRFSISWTRILPRGRFGEVNQNGVTFYNKILDDLLWRGIKPFVTIYHHDFPQELQDRYESWLNPLMQEDYVHFAETCFKNFGDRVKHWITINEPNLFTQMAYQTGKYPPARCSPPFGNCSAGNSDIEPLIAVHNLLLSHGKAVEIYRKYYQHEQGGSIGIVVDCLNYAPLTDSDLDQEAAKRGLAFYIGWVLDPLIFGEYPSEMRRYLGNSLPRFSKAESNFMTDCVDFIGVNYYTTQYAKDCIYSSCSLTGNRPIKGFVDATSERDGILIGEPTAIEILKVVPNGIGEMIDYLKKRYDNKPMFITENGYSEPNVQDQVQNILNDEKRIEFHKMHLWSLAQAIRDGANVRGYFVWTLMDDFEWIHGCDLVICAGDCKEKLASGLLEPFVAHLKYAKDQVSKGGYSIKLSAPDSAFWFTKSTLERFVRFVSTPEVLERFITIEREIANIDCSIITNVPSDSQLAVNGLDEYSNKSAAFAYKYEDNTNDAVHEDDSKVRLQRILETRKAVLQREQAMVYARALVAGYETDNLADLVCFADAFGSPRLRDACMNFMELCNTKSNDTVWMDEVAAMQAYSRSQYDYMERSGGILEYDHGKELRINVKQQNGSVDGATDSSISHGSHFHPYMQTNQAGPTFQPPYQGYPFPGMVVPPYYQGNLPWPPNVEDSRHRGKLSHMKGSQDDNFDSSDSSSESDSGSDKRSSSRKVVIRNINYINPMSDGGSDAEREYDDNLDLVRSVENKQEEDMITQQWNIFQNLLMKDANSNESKEVTKRSNDGDSLNGNKNNVGNLRSTDDVIPVIKRHSTFKEELVSHKFEGPAIIPSVTRPKERDIFEDNFKPVERTKDVLVDDPLAVQDRSLSGLSDSQLRTQDVLMVPETNQNKKKVEATYVNEPSDLYIVLERDTSCQETTTAWNPEMESESCNQKVVKLDFAAEGKSTKSRTKTLVGKGLERKGTTIEAKSKALVGSRSKKSAETKTTKPNGQSEKDEEKRKKMEELLTQRQKRIAERSALMSKTTKIDKSNAQRVSRDIKKPNKPVIKSSTIDRLSAARVVNPKVLPTKSKPDNIPTKATIKKNAGSKLVSKPAKVTTKENGTSHASVSQKTVGDEKKKVKPTKAKPINKNIGSTASSGPKKKTADINTGKQLPKASSVKKFGNGVAQIGLSPRPQLDNKKGETETLQKPSIVIQRDKPRSVTFSINEDNGAKDNPNVKLNPEIPMMKNSTPLPGKSSPGRSNSRKKWTKVETTTKVLNGFKKFLSFARMS